MSNILSMEEYREKKILEYHKELGDDLKELYKPSGRKPLYDDVPEIDLGDSFWMSFYDEEEEF